MAGTVRMRTLIISLLATLLTFSIRLQAQTVEVRAIATADSLSIGEQFKLQLLLKMPSGFDAQWPVFGDTLNKHFEIVSKTQVETLPIDNNQHVLMRQELTLTTFDTGYLKINPINIRFAPPGDSMRFVASTNPLTIMVLLPDVDPAAPIRAIKDIEKQPITLAEILPWIIALILVGLALWMGLRFYLRYKNRPVAITPLPSPTIPPHQLAIEQLEQLRHEKLWQAGRVKEYYVRLSDIVRVYIEAQFPVNAVEMTTQEIMQAIRKQSMNEEAKQKLQSALELADLVKFAKFKPSPIENDMAINHIVDFVVESFASLVETDQTHSKEEKA